jgi:ectoine hydroxylase-related dioxygenase (phytanoyl-CoA dioxygenase family)
MSIDIAVLPDLDDHVRPSAEAIESFHRDGHIKLSGVLTPEELEAYRVHIERAVFDSPEEHHAVEQRVAGGNKNWMFTNNLWTLDRAARQFVLSRRFARIAAELMGVDAVRLFRDQSYFKAAGGANTPWHQDAYFMPLDTQHIVTFWIPLTDITLDMAPMSYVTGSHLAGYMGTSKGDDESMDRFEEHLRAGGYRIFNYEAFVPGEIAVHAGMTLHSSRANVSSRMREVLVLVYFGDGARLAPEPPMSQDMPPQEYFATIIRREVRKTSLPGLKSGELAAGDMTPLVYRREQPGQAS